jgi:hypothetical protein
MIMSSSSSSSDTLLGALAAVGIGIGVLLWSFYYLRNTDLSRSSGLPGGGAPSFSEARFNRPSPIDKLEDRLSEHETSSSSDVADATPVETTKTDKTDAPVAATSASTETTKTAVAATPATSATITPGATAKPQRVGLSAVLGDEATGGDGQGHR